MEEETDNRPAKLQEFVGKTIAAIVHEDTEGRSDEQVRITFTDGTELRLQSADYEGYRSYIYVNGLTGWES